MSKKISAPYKPTIHDLKTWIEYFEEILFGFKTFEVRKNDRNFTINDFINLKEWDNEKQKYTGRKLLFRISYILPGGQFGIEEGYCVIQLKPIYASDELLLPQVEVKY